MPRSGAATATTRSASPRAFPTRPRSCSTEAGNDTINGSSGDEILIAGPDGADDLDGRAGDDALFSGPGGDALDGGDGNDQLVTSDACGGHD